MAASSARRMMLFSSMPVASMRMVVFVGLCITEAPSLGLGSIFEPSVYTQASGSHMGVHGVVVGGLCAVCWVEMFGRVGSGSRLGGLGEWWSWAGFKGSWGVLGEGEGWGEVVCGRLGREVGRVSRGSCMY